MKQPTAPIYPELPSEDGQNYRLQKISEIEKQLIRETDVRKALYKKYNRAINFTDSIDTTLISASVIMAGIGLAVPVMLPLEIAAIVCGCMGACVKLVRRKLMSKAQKHYEIKTIGESKLNSVKNLFSKALADGQISAEEFQLVLCALDRYNDLKDKTRTKQSGIGEQEKKKLIEEGRAQALALFRKKKKNKRHIILFSKFVFANDPPPKYKKNVLLCVSRLQHSIIKNQIVCVILLSGVVLAWFQSKGSKCKNVFTFTYLSLCCFFF